MAIAGSKYSLLSFSFRFNYLLVFLFAVTNSLQALADLREHCQSETFTASCADDEVIVIRSAQYGRMKIGRCIHTEYGGNVGCRASVIRQTDRICSGRQNCQILISDRSFDNPPLNCPRNLQSYFEVIYECLPVLSARQPDCATDKGIALRQPTGFISNYVTERYGYGSVSCPWRIELPRGERVNITLVDFTLPTADTVGGGGGVGAGTAGGGDQVAYHGRPCYQYAIITEKWSMTRHVRICGGDRRERNVYTSRTNSVEIRIVTRKNVDTEKEFYFLLQFEAIGCSDPEPPKHGWVQRDADGGAYMGCNHTNQVWRMSCDGTRWIGEFENCSALGSFGSVKRDEHVMTLGSLAIPFTISISIICTLAVIVVTVVLLMGLFCVECFKGSRSRHRRRSIPLPSEPCDANNKHHRKKNKTAAEVDQSTSSTMTSSFSKQQQQKQQRGNSAYHGDACSSHQTVVRASIAAPPSAASQQTTPPNDYTPPPPRGILVNSGYGNNAAMASSGTAAAAVSANSTDYVREMWPMAPPPCNAASAVGGAAILFDHDAADSRGDLAHFQYGDSVTLNTVASAPAVVGDVAPLPPPPALVPPPTATASHRVGRHSGAFESEDDTHIYETPKYLRREKAATLRLQKGALKTQSQYYDGSTGQAPTTRQQHQPRVTIAEPPYESTMAASRYSRTLPRDGLNNNRRS